MSNIETPIQKKPTSHTLHPDLLVKIHRTREQLVAWISVNQIKQDLNDEILSLCIPSILKLFGSNVNLLEYLITYSPKDTLNKMYKIIQEQIQE